MIPVGEVRALTPNELESPEFVVPAAFPKPLMVSVPPPANVLTVPTFATVEPIGRGVNFIKRTI